MIRAKIKQVLINTLFIVPAFVIQNRVFPLFPFLSASLNLLLILMLSFGFICGKNAGMFYGVPSGPLLDLFYSGSFGLYTLIYIYIGYANGILTKYYYKGHITLPLIPSIFNGIWYNIYMYVFRLLIRGYLNLPYYLGNIMLLEIIFTAVIIPSIYRPFLPASRCVEDIGKRRDTKLVWRTARDSKRILQKAV